MPKSNVQKPRKSQPKTKKAQVMALLMRRSGATVAQIARATDWQAHSVRAALTRLRQEGIAVERDQTDGVSRYRIARQRKAA